MPRDTDNAASATESAANAGEKVIAEMTRAGETAARAGERVAAERTEAASTAYSAGMEAAFKAVQEYNTKLIQVFQTNTEANLQLGQTLMQSRSPMEFVEAMGKSMRERTELIAGQTRELAALRQTATRCMIEAVAPRR